MKTKNFERIVIIDHINHQLYVEDIDTDLLNEKYNGEEESYIRDNYTLESVDFDNYDSWSWDYVTDCNYTGPVSGMPYDLGEKIDELFDEDIEDNE